MQDSHLMLAFSSPMMLVRIANTGRIFRTHTFDYLWAMTLVLAIPSINFQSQKSTASCPPFQTTFPPSICSICRGVVSTHAQSKAPSNIYVGRTHLSEVSDDALFSPETNQFDSMRNLQRPVRFDLDDCTTWLV